MTHGYGYIRGKGYGIVLGLQKLKSSLQCLNIASVMV